MRYWLELQLNFHKLKNGDKHKDAEALSVYESMIDVFFYSKPSEGLNNIIHNEFIEYGTAAQGFYGKLKKLRNSIKTQPDQLRSNPIELTRNPIMQRFLTDASLFIVEEFHIHDHGNTYQYTARLSAVLDKIDDRWLLTHFHGSTENSRIKEDEVFEIDGLRRKNLELEQKIIERTRELEIESALEQVRAAAMDMKKHEDMLTVAESIYNELYELGFSNIRNAIIDIHNDDKRTFLDYDYSPELGKSITLMSYDDDPIIEKQIRQFESNKDSFFEMILEGQELQDLINLRIKNGEKEDPRLLEHDQLTYNLYSFGNGEIGISYFGKLSDDQKLILRKFKNVFALSYKRYNDLVQAENQAREAIKQASLDRVRGEISSMRNADDLGRITPLVFNELTTLGIPFTRCGVFIVNENEKSVAVYLSASDGRPLATMTLPFGVNEMTIRAVAAWEKKEVLFQHWHRADFINWSNSMQEQGYIKDLDTYNAGITPESLHLHFVPFKQGLLYVGSTETLFAEQINLVRALARSFAVAYSRYEDFVNLEQAKAAAESAMEELKSTQAQLVQQENLASLGQLTAGIAHEIKNPLNFVNNFSELNIELIDEIYDELKKFEGNSNTDIFELLRDLRSNQRKIYEHGKRADGIVKSMLQHSRGGSGKIEPTDLNHLIREYVNLSFHGMRAGKKPINVSIDLQLDENVGMVPLISEDFSRVILNICNNAFDAMWEKFNAHPDTEYNPKLTVKTFRKNGNVALQIKDNGGGIPEEFRDKILQPFFTTKKGTEGTGLGLSITNDIIKAHNGSLEIISEKDHYTSFNILLPNKL